MLEFRSFGRTTIVVLLCKFLFFSPPMHLHFSRKAERLSEGFFWKMKRVSIFIVNTFTLYIRTSCICKSYICTSCLFARNPASFYRMVSFKMLAFAACSQKRERGRDEYWHVKTCVNMIAFHENCQMLRANTAWLRYLCCWFLLQHVIWACRKRCEKEWSLVWFCGAVMAGRFGSYCKRCFCCFGNLRDPGFLFCCRAARTAAQLEILLTVSARVTQQTH